LPQGDLGYQPLKQCDFRRRRLHLQFFSKGEECRGPPGEAATNAGDSAMKIIVPFLILSVTACLCVAQTHHGIQRAKTVSAPVGEKGYLTCSISVQEPEWRESQHAEVALVVENRLGAEVSMRVVPFFELEPLDAVEERRGGEFTYLALWDLEKGTTLPFDATTFLELKTGESTKITSDVASFSWTRFNSSLPPDSGLFRVVSAGKYSLRLELIGRNGRAICSSNAVDVFVR
jgi:hypothetical protein